METFLLLGTIPCFLGSLPSCRPLKAETGVRFPRLKAVEAPEELIDEIMGHRSDKPKYGDGYGLGLKLKYCETRKGSGPEIDRCFSCTSP